MRWHLLLILSLLFLLPASGQDLPKKIRGYTVHREPVVVTSGTVSGEAGDAAVRVGDPVLTDVSLSGVSFELPGEVTSIAQSGKVDFLTFHDFQVNGVPVEIEEYVFPFSFRKNEVVTLPRPAKLFLPTAGILKAAWKEMHETTDEWTVTGRVFVFGKFRKYGFHHKRVVPIDVSLRIKNPLIR
ncbi:MAG TPA: hypothetical protein VFZ23_10410 [Pyrinomonadaceae bacterium]